MLDTLTASTRAPVAATSRGERNALAVRGALVNLADVPVAAWSALMARAIEPNAFYHPAWARAVSASARGHSGAKALVAFDARNRLIGLLPVQSAWRVLKLPIPVLVSWQPYAPLTTPMLDRDRAEDAAAGLIDAAAQAGARAILLDHHTAHGKAMAAFYGAARRRGASPRLLSEHQRALLDAARDAERLMLDALGPKKTKELRRQRNRLADGGAVAFAIATAPDDVADALEKFLALEAAGWKGRRGTALAQDAGDATFIRTAARALAAEGHCRIATLTRAGVPIAAGIVLRHAGRAYFFKVAHDESLARLSPGVQLTLDLTRHLAGDPEISDADSIAVADHPMIDRLWRDRLAIATTLFPTRADDAWTTPLERLIAARNRARDFARSAFHTIRTRLEFSR